MLIDRRVCDSVQPGATLHRCDRARAERDTNGEHDGCRERVEPRLVARTPEPGAGYGEVNEHVGSPRRPRDQDLSTEIPAGHVAGRGWHRQSAAVGSLVDDEAGQCQRRDIQLALVSEVVSDQDTLHISNEDMSAAITAKFSPGPTAFKAAESCKFTPENDGQMPLGGQMPIVWTLRAVRPATSSARDDKLHDVPAAGRRDAGVAQRQSN